MKRKDCGLTLIEILIGLAILAVMALSFTALFTSSFAGIFSAGRKSTALFQAQQQMEQKIAGGTSGNTPLTITLPDLTTIQVQGEILSVPYSYEDKTGTIISFIPIR